MIKNDTKESKWKQFFAGKGFYIALGCCVLAAGVTAWGALGSKIGTQDAKDTTPYVEQNDATRATMDWDTGKQAGAPATNVPDERPAEATAQATDPRPDGTTGKTEFLLPLGSDILRDYSDGEMVYSQTMDDWRAHNGIDFKGEAGDAVQAVAAGTVLRVTNDPLWGILVEIDHGNGLVALYCGLDQNPAVQEGASVAAGDRLGLLGAIPSEASDDPHLHFEVRVDGKLTDPLTALNKV